MASVKLLSVAAFAFFFSNYFGRPLVTQVTVEVVCHNHGLSGSECNNAAVSADAALVNLYSELAYNIPALVVSGIYGQLSDQRGRRLTMSLPLFGMLCYYSSFFLLAYTQSQYYTVIIVAGSFLEGIFGGNGAFYMSVFSYVADLTTENKESRGGYFSLIESAIIVSKIIGPLIGGVWAEKSGFADPLILICVMLFAGILWVNFVLPESNTAVVAANAERQHRNEKGLPEIASEKMTLDPFKTLRNVAFILSLKGPAPYIFFSFFFYNTAFQFERAINTLYEKHVFSFSPSYIGYLDSFQSVLTVISMATPSFLFYCFNFQIGDMTLVQIGYVGRAAFYFLYPFVTNAWQVFLLSVLLVLCGTVVPRTRSLCSNAVSNVEQAQMQASFSALQAVSLLLSIFSSLGYSETVGSYAGTMYFVCFGITLVAVLIAWRVLATPELYHQLPKPGQTEGDDRTDLDFQNASVNDEMLFVDELSTREPLLIPSGPSPYKQI